MAMEVFQPVAVTRCVSTIFSLVAPAVLSHWLGKVTTTMIRWYVLEGYAAPSVSQLLFSKNNLAMYT